MYIIPNNSPLNTNNSLNRSSAKTNSVNKSPIIDDLVKKILQDLGEGVEESQDSTPLKDNSIKPVPSQRDKETNRTAAKTFLLSKKLLDCFSKEGKMAPLTQLKDLETLAMNKVNHIYTKIAEGKENPKLLAKICFCIFLPFKKLGEMFKNLYRGAGFKMDFQVLEKSKENFKSLQDRLKPLYPLFTRPASNTPSDIALSAQKISAFLTRPSFKELPPLIQQSLS